MQYIQIKLPKNNPKTDSIIKRSKRYYGLIFDPVELVLVVPCVWLGEIVSLIEKQYPNQANLIRTSNRYELAWNIYDSMLRNTHIQLTDAPNFDVKHPAHTLPYVYQKSAISSILNRFFDQHRDVLLADDQGLGKTGIVIWSMSSSNNKINTAFIVCPAVAKINWKREFKKFHPDDISVCVVNSSTKQKEADRAAVVICNYESLHRAQELTKNREFDLLCADEGHALGNMKAKRTSLVKTISERCKHKIILSGTPFNRPKKLWPILNIFDPEFFESQTKFEEHFCAPKDNPYSRTQKNVNGSAREDILKLLLYRLFCIRRTKEQVRDDLPAKTFRYLPLELSNKIRKLEKGLHEEFGDYPNLPELPVGFYKKESVHKMRVTCGLEKVNVISSYIEDIIEDNSVLIFAYHKEVQEAYRKKFPDWSYIEGGMTEKKRWEQIDRFMEGKCNGMVLSIDSANYALNLTRANISILAEAVHKWDKVLQAGDRTHRTGQTRDCEFLIPFIENSLDENILTRARNDQKCVDKILEMG